MVRNLYWKFLGCLYLYLGCLLRLSRYLGKHVLLWLAFQVTNIGNTARCAAQIRYRTRYSDRWIKRYEKKRQPFQLIIINDLSSFSSIAYLPFPSSLPTPTPFTHPFGEFPSRPAYILHSPLTPLHSRPAPPLHKPPLPTRSRTIPFRPLPPGRPSLASRRRSPLRHIVATPIISFAFISFSLCAPGLIINFLAFFVTWIFSRD